MNLYHRKCCYCKGVVDLSVMDSYKTIPYTALMKIYDKLTINMWPIGIDNRYSCINCITSTKRSDILKRIGIK